ncbi:hypothetical protein evm_000098, partial [Chilo suppressalis]
MSKVLHKLGDALPDERPLLSLQIVESVAKCPAGYRPVNRTYDEDADAGLLRQNGLFGKKPSHYICLSKSEGVPGYVMDGVVIVGEREPAPAGFSVAGRAGKRRLCTRVSRPTPAACSRPAVTDVIVCSRMRQAPHGFILAGEINGKMVCYKVSGGSAETSPTHAPNEYENVVTNLTPDANRRLRPAPERPPKLSPLISELNNLNLKSPTGAEFTTDHDYEALSPAYQVRPVRAAPRPPASPALAPAPAPVRHKGPAPLPRNNYQTLGWYDGMEGVPFVLNPKLRGLPNDSMGGIKSPPLYQATIISRWDSTTACRP